MSTRIPIKPELFPHLVITSRHTETSKVLSQNALKIMHSVYWEPHKKHALWQQMQTASLARALGAMSVVSSASCLTHTSAALVLGLPMWNREPDVYVAVPGKPKCPGTRLPIIHFQRDGLPTIVEAAARFDRQTFLWRRRLDIPEQEIVIVEQTPVTNILRTAFDCAFDEPPHNALVIADSALRAYCEPDRRRPELAMQREDEAREIWKEMFRRYPHRRRVASARAILSAASPWSESPAESMNRWLILALGLPLPELQRSIPTTRGPKFPDLCWPDYKLIVEVDGHLKYGSGEVLVEEKLRQEALDSLGWRFIRVTTSEFSDLSALADKLMSGLPYAAVKGARPRKVFWGDWRGPNYRLPSISRAAGGLRKSKSHKR